MNKTQNLSALDADATEGVELLDTLIDNIAKDGNYSAEATLTFLSQIRQCFATPSAPGTPEAPGEFRTCCDHPDCTTCAGRGGFYRMASKGGV